MSMPPQQPSAGTERTALLEEFNRTGRRGSAAGLSFSRAVARRLGLARTDLEMLDLIEAVGPLSAGHLGDLVGLSSGTVTTVVDRLVDRGLVSREPDPEDRRRVAISANERRPEELTAIYGPLWERLVSFLDDYSDEELALYNRMADDLADQMFAYAQRLRGDE